MKWRLKGMVKSAALAAPLVCAGYGADAAPLELALLIDGSGSISSSDFDLQIDAYESIFNDNFFTNIVSPSIYTEVFVGAWQFSTGVSFIGEQSITSDAEAQTFATALGGTTQISGLTNIGQALLDANTWFDTNAAQGDNDRVVDVSTDGSPTAGGSGESDTQFALNAADAVRADGGSVNAIGVGSVSQVFLNNLTTPGGFFVTADNFGEFEAALADKITREVQGGNPVPAPTPLLLLCIGLLGLGLSRSSAPSRPLG